MYFELTLPDELYQQYGSQQAIYKRLVETADLPEDTDWKLKFTDKQLADLRRYFGKFTTADQLFQKILTVGVIKLQGVELQLDSDQTRRLKDLAFANARVGEPRSEQEAENYPQKITKNMIQRYVREEVLDAVSVIMGLD